MARKGWQARGTVTCENQPSEKMGRVLSPGEAAAWGREAGRGAGQGLGEWANSQLRG